MADNSESVIRSHFITPIDSRTLSAYQAISPTCGGVGSQNVFYNPGLQYQQPILDQRSYAMSNLLTLLNGSAPATSNMGIVNQLISVLGMPGDYAAGGLFSTNPYLSTLSPLGLGNTLGLFGVLFNTFSNDPLLTLDSLPSVYSLTEPVQYARCCGYNSSVPSYYGYTNNLVSNMPAYLGLANAAGYYFESSRPTLGATGNPCADPYNSYPGPCDMTNGLLGPLGDAVTSLLSALGDALGVLANAIAQGFAYIAQALAPILGLLAQVVGAILESIAALAQMLNLNDIFGLIGSLLGLLSNPCATPILQQTVNPNIRGALGF